MTMNEIIRSRRKELNLTQESIAELLGVSIPAVSKWESGATYPDVTIIPALARVLKTDVNTLLCFKQELSKQEITNIVNKVTTIVMTQGIEKAFEIADEKMREYPTDMKLIHTLAMTMQGALMISEITEEQKNLYEKKIDSLYEKVGQSGETNAAMQSNYMLASKALNADDFEKTQLLLDLLPDPINLDKQMLQAKLLLKKGNTDAAAKIYEENILNGLNKIQLALTNLIVIAIREGDEETANELVRCGESMTGSFGLWRYSYYLYSFEKACELKETKNIIAILKNMLDSVVVSWNTKQSPVAKHLSGYSEQSVTQSGMGEKLLSVLIMDIKEKPEYEFIRNEPEYGELINRYKV